MALISINFLRQNISWENIPGELTMGGVFERVELTDVSIGM